MLCLAALKADLPPCWVVQLSWFARECVLGQNLSMHMPLGWMAVGLCGRGVVTAWRRHAEWKTAQHAFQLTTATTATTTSPRFTTPSKPTNSSFSFVLRIAQVCGCLPLPVRLAHWRHGQRIINVQQ